VSTRELVRQLRAVEAGGPIARYSTRHTRQMSNPMMVAFVRMAGESRPWGIVYGRLKEKSPTFLTAPDGRNRLDVSEICEEFGQVMLAYMHAESATFSPMTKDNADDLELPQIWLPGPRHIEMFHYLEYSFFRVRKGDDRTKPLTVFARLSGWLFRESSQMGQQMIVDAAALMKNMYVFPADNIGISNLTNANAWFDVGAELNDKRLAVRSAGDVRVSPTLDPNIDSKTLSPLVEARGVALKDGKSTKVFEDKIREVLVSELQTRWTALLKSYKILLDDPRPENSGVDFLVHRSKLNFVNEFQRVERNLQDPDLGPAFTPHPETDFHGSAAASNYFQMSAADTAYLATLVHDDQELLQESLVAGRSFIGEVTQVYDTGVGRTTTPIWRMTVPIADQLRLRESERYAPLGEKLHTFLVRSVEIIEDQELLIEGEWIDRKTREISGEILAKPADLSWTGHKVIFVPKDSSSMELSSSRAVWSAAKGPGAWLTHGRAPAVAAEGTIDDITQLTGDV